jgi:hypothetical protein
MIRAITLCLALCLLFVAMPAQAWLWGDNDHPDEDKITQWVQSEIPNAFEVRSVEIGLQEVKKVFGQEFSASRVLVTIKARQPMYRLGNRMAGDKRVATPVEVKPVKIGFLVEAKSKADGWDVNVVLQSRRALRDAGRTRESLSGALILGSPEYKAHIATLDAREAELYRSATGEFSGVMVCGRQNVNEIQKFTIDARSGTAQMVYRNAGNEDMSWSTHELKVERQNDRFYLRNLPGREKSFNRIYIEDGGKWHDDLCDVHMYRSNKIPPEVAEQRRREAQALTALSSGPVPARLTEGDRQRQVAVKIVEVFERGFRMAVDQPHFINGSFNNSEETRVRSVIDVRFTDAPAPLLLDGTVEGSGEPAIRSHCAPTAEISEGGTILFDSSGSYGCDERLELYTSEAE